MLAKGTSYKIESPFYWNLNDLKCYYWKEFKYKVNLYHTDNIVLYNVSYKNKCKGIMMTMLHGKGKVVHLRH